MSFSLLESYPLYLKKICQQTSNDRVESLLRRVSSRRISGLFRLSETYLVRSEQWTVCTIVRKSTVLRTLIASDEVNTLATKSTCARKEWWLKYVMNMYKAQIQTCSSERKHVDTLTVKRHPHWTKSKWPGLETRGMGVTLRKCACQHAQNCNGLSPNCTLHRNTMRMAHTNAWTAIRGSLTDVDNRHKA